MDSAAIRLVENPPGIADEYLRGFNACFDCAWTPECLAWYIERPFDSRRPDVAAMLEGGRLVAGLAINYRQLRLPCGDLANVGILTGGWTLPAHRGRRHFTRLIETLTGTAQRRGCLAVLGFVTNDNASGGVLRRAGAYTVPAHYLHASADADLRSAAPAAPEIASCRSRRNGAAVVFHYPTQTDWADQFLDRPWSTSRFSIDAGLAVVEHAGETDRLQYLAEMPRWSVGALTEVALLSRRKRRSFFAYTTSTSLARGAEDWGIQRRSGSILVLELPALHATAKRMLAELRQATWLVQAGDRM